MLKKVVLVCSLVALFFACSSSEESSSSSNNVDGFDRSAILTNWADNIIIPAYQDLDNKLDVLKTDKDVFITSPNQTNLDNLRASWLSSYKVWQSVEMFNIGKAEEILLTFKMNVYPTTTTDVEMNVSSGSYDLRSDNNNDAVGFPAIEYLLYGIAADDTAILSKFSDVKYQNYLSDLVNEMSDLTDIVLNDWVTNYRASFIANSDNTATSSVNKLTNDFIFYYEKGLRANKVGIPAGVFSGSTPFSNKVEGYYSKDFSRELALDALQAVQDFFVGKAYNQTTTSTSFASYLNYLNRADLVATISDRFNNGRTKLQSLNANLSNQVTTDNTKMTETFDILQLAVVPLKVDMIQAMNISVDFVDADGD